MYDRVPNDVAEDCLAAARDAMPELAERFADPVAATVPWMLTIHAGGGWQVIQGGGALRSSISPASVLQSGREQRPSRSRLIWNAPGLKMTVCPNIAPDTVATTRTMREHELRLGAKRGRAFDEVSESTIDHAPTARIRKGAASHAVLNRTAKHSAA
jgi:hypothetical protein